MATHGTKESDRLRLNVEDQLNRLLQQLQDLDLAKADGDIDEEEYASSRTDTLDQMKEFEATLNKLVSGDVSLISQFDSYRNAVHAYIVGSCRDPGITKMFANKSTSGLRNKLASLEQDLKLGRIQPDAFNSLAIDILLALEKLGEALTANEVDMLEKNKRNLDGFVVAEDQVGSHIIDAAKRS